MANEIYESPKLEQVGTGGTERPMAAAVPILLAPYVWDAAIGVNYAVAVNVLAGVNVLIPINAPSSKEA